MTQGVRQCLLHAAIDREIHRLAEAPGQVLQLALEANVWIGASKAGDEIGNQFFKRDPSQSHRRRRARSALFMVRSLSLM